MFSRQYILLKMESTNTIPPVEFPRIIAISNKIEDLVKIIKETYKKYDIKIISHQINTDTIQYIVDVYNDQFVYYISTNLLKGDNYGKICDY